ncbi:T9SS type A sorting domain-containing protein [candidate division KSB1 bacterium]|nr:T9SS type A sorting domain-containing protein [candidate division KSB1 bacterium]
MSLLVSGVEKDTITNHRWIISKYSSSEIIDELIFSPQADTFVTKGDSLLISVVYNVGEDSLKYVWFLNSELIYDHPDSIYTYKPDTAVFKIDTVQLFVIDAINDTSRAHEWLISNEKPRIPLKLASAFPATDTTIFRGDSLQFIARLQSPRPDSVSFRWFVNEEEILSQNDSLFQYLANDSSISSDSIQVFISDRDSVIHLVWQVTVLEKPKLYQLEAPVLVYPLNHEQMSDDGKFIWSTDSLDTFDNEGYRYVFQISTDTLFADIVVSDTVEADTFIRFVQIPDRDKINGQQPYFWRVQAIGKNDQMSDFRICRNDFSYLPPFIELTNFYAERITKGHIAIYWETGYELQNFGFNIYRSRKSSDNFIKINEDVITGEKSYSFVDETVTAGETFYYQLEEICKNGDKKTHPAITVEMPMPENFNLFPNYPNPFNTITLVRYQLPAASQVTIDVYNVLGRRIRTLVDEVKEAGFYTVTWDGLDSDGFPVVSGLYFYRMHAGSFKTTRKMTVVR